MQWWSIVEIQVGVRDKGLPTLVTAKPDRPSSPAENCLPIPDRFIDRKELRRMIPVSPMTFRRWEAAGQFPRRVRLGKYGQRCVWRLSSVLAWMCEQEAA